MRDDLNNVSSYLLDLIHSFLRRASENVNTVILFYTHSQQAQIGTFSHLLLSYVETLSRDLDRLNEVYDRVNTCPLGGGANVVRLYVSIGIELLLYLGLEDL
jgi:argininosuccinate lyase